MFKISAPSLRDGGDCELVDVEDGIVKLRLLGVGSCPSSTITLKAGIERAHLKKFLDFEVEQVF
jgi:Fe-S cluster biogenesis protein NfuA